MIEPSSFLHFKSFFSCFSFLKFLDLYIFKMHICFEWLRKCEYILSITHRETEYTSNIAFVFKRSGPDSRFVVQSQFWFPPVKKGSFPSHIQLTLNPHDKRVNVSVLGTPLGTT
eukprot:106857_1